MAADIACTACCAIFSINHLATEITEQTAETKLNPSHKSNCLLRRVNLNETCCYRFDDDVRE